MKKWVQQLFDSADKCYYCELVFGSPNHAINAGVKTKDHIIPLTKKGRNIPENLVVCCLWCNGEKGNRSLVDFFDHIQNKFNHISKKRLSLHLQRNKDVILENITLLIKKIDPYYHRLTYKKGDRNNIKFSETVIQKPKEKKQPVKGSGSLVGNYLKRHRNDAADINLSVNSNTGTWRPPPKNPHRDSDKYVQWIPGEKIQSKEEVLALQSQTVEEFKYKKNLDDTVKRLLAAPPENFHYL